MEHNHTQGIGLKIYLLLSVQLLTVGIVAAQPSVLASLDSTNFVIGDRFVLHLEANHPDNATIESIDISELKSLDNIDIEDESDWDTLKTQPEVILQKNLTLQVWDSGAYWIPQIAFVFEQNGTTLEQKTNPIPISVTTVAMPDSIQLTEIKDIEREPANWRDYLPFFLLLLAIALVVLFFYWNNKRKKRVDTPEPEPVKPPAHEIALAALNQLQSEKLWQQGEIKTYQSRLTHIIREYLENRYDTPALESTTDQILKNLQSVDFDRKWKDKLRNILQVADLVKFAKAKPPADFHEQVLEQAREFVIATKAQPIVETEETTHEQT